MGIIENYIARVHQELGDSINDNYISLYDHFKNQYLKEIFSTFHNRLLVSLNRMNERLPTREGTAYFWAEDSRTLINIIEKITELKQHLSDSVHAFELDDLYNERINLFLTFLSRSGGSIIPENTSKNVIYEIKPIFRIKNSIIIKPNSTVELNLIGEGSYALVYKYYDENYDTHFVKKVLKKDTSQVEKERFKLEFSRLKLLSCPYVISVYKYDENRDSYTMEFMDLTLEKYIKDNNDKLSYQDRKKIGLQILFAIEYIHSREILHRDISLKNILIKRYEGLIVAKLADFGLIKIPQSQLTSKNTEIKGYLNDPDLELVGFENYELVHEIYSLTRLLYYVMTGRTKNLTKERDKFYKFLEKGINPNKNARYQTVRELKDSFIFYCTD